jgi:hypothetical protein
LTTAKTLLRARQQGFGTPFGPPCTSQVVGVAEPVELIVLAS